MHLFLINKTNIQSQYTPLSSMLTMHVLPSITMIFDDNIKEVIKKFGKYYTKA